MKSAGYWLLARIPPTFAAARNTYSGRSRSKNALHRARVQQVQLRARPEHQIAEPLRGQPPHQRRAHQPQVAGDVDFRVLLHERNLVGISKPRDMPTPPTPASNPDFTQILGIRFFIGSVDRLLALAAGGGLFVVPSAPGLAELDRDASYRRSLEESDAALTDSGAMVLLWRLRTGQRIHRISGLQFIRALLASHDFREPHRVFWVMPSEHEAAANLTWLNAHGVPTTLDDVYVAPRYDAGAVSDPLLVDVIRNLNPRPRFVVLCIAGGVQEPLGLALRNALDLSAGHRLHRGGPGLRHRTAGLHPGLGRPAHARLAPPLPLVAPPVRAPATSAGCASCRCSCALPRTPCAADAAQYAPSIRSTAGTVRTRISTSLKMFHPRM